MHLIVYMADVAARRVLPDLEANGQAAVVVGGGRRRARVPGQRGRSSSDASSRARGTRRGRGAVEAFLTIWKASASRVFREPPGPSWPCVAIASRAPPSSSRRRARRGSAAAMTSRSRSLATCFQGLLPAQLFTCSRDGIPNAAYLSHVDYVDSTHVALSFQFFNKSRRNIAENPHALVIVIDPDTGQGWQLRLAVRALGDGGPLFERMALRIEAIASYCGLKGIFKLRAADVYEVGDRAVREKMEPASAEPRSRASGPRRRSGVHDEGDAGCRAANPARRLSRDARRLDSRGLEESFGFKHSMILVPVRGRTACWSPSRPVVTSNGAGAEVRFGEGIAGMVAEARKPIRISGLLRGMLYALRDAQAAEQTGVPGAGSRCPDSPIRRVSSACRCSSVASSSACCASKAKCAIASTRTTRRRSSCSATTGDRDSEHADPGRAADVLSTVEPAPRRRQRAPPRPHPARTRAARRARSPTTAPTNASWSTASI